MNNQKRRQTNQTVSKFIDTLVEFYRNVFQTKASREGPN